MLRGVNASCQFRTNRETKIELLEDDLIYVTNFRGNVTSNVNSVMINGTCLIRIFNETILIGNKTFTNKRISGLQALPPILTNVYESTHKVDSNFLHELHEKNIGHIQNLMRHINLSLGSNAAIFLSILTMATILIIIWKKIFGRIVMPTVNTVDQIRPVVN